jgi:PIN domain nuclease of toxin-antitoxin system
MSVVLDTHTVLWYLEYSKESSSIARTTIEDAIREPAMCTYPRYP